MATNRITVPAGKIYVDPFDASDNPTGERYAGDTAGAEIGADVSALQVYLSDEPVSELMDSIAHTVVRSFKFTAVELSDNIVAQFLAADPLTKTQTSGSVLDELISGVIQGRYYQLGKSSGNPTGVRGVSAVTVTNDAATPVTYATPAAYTLDADLGRIYIVPGGTITNGTNLKVDYTRASNSREQLSSTVDLQARLRCAIRFIANNLSGTNRDIYFPRVVLMADGTCQIKKEGNNATIAKMGFKVEVIKPEGMASMYIDGRPV